MDVAIKFCGLRRVEEVTAAAELGARYIGLNFFEPSPRYIAPDLARDLALATPAGVAKVGLVVNADDAALDALLGVVPLDMIQLHGKEPPARVADVRARYGLPVMKAIGVSGPEDLAQIDAYAPVADQLLIDAKPPKGADLPGGNGVSFDWQLLAGRKYWTVPWMLAGGLTPENVAEAVARTGAKQVDLSSGVESAPGVKDPAKMADFARALREPAAPIL